MTEQEYYNTFSEDLLEDFKKLHAQEKTLMEVAEKHGETFREKGRVCVKASLINAYTLWIKMNNIV